MGVIERIGKVSSASVFKGTGKYWHQWIEILEKAGGRSLTHRELVAHLKKKHKLSIWWQQGVSTGFEMHIGRKVEGRNDKGEYSAIASATFPVENKKFWRWMIAEAGMAVWLKPMSQVKIKRGNQFEIEGGIFGEIRTFKAPQRLRFTWQDENWDKPSVVQVYMHSRPNRKTTLTFSHEKLKTDRLRLDMRDHWRSVLQNMRSILPRK